MIPELNLNQPRGLRAGLLPTSQPLEMDQNFLDNENKIHERSQKLEKIARDQENLEIERQREDAFKAEEEKRRVAIEEIKSRQLLREKELKDEEARRQQALDLAKQQREMLEKKADDDETRVSNRQKRVDTAMDDRLTYMEKSRELEKPEFLVKTYNQRYRDLIEEGDLSPLTLDEVSYKTKPVSTSLDPRDPKYKASTDLIKENIQENRKLASTLNGLRGAVGQIDQLPEDEFNNLASWKSVLGNTMSALGIDTAFVRDAQSLEQLQKSLEKQNLGVLKTFLTGAISNAEGERVASALGTITDRKASLIASYKLMIAENEFKYESRLLENAILDKQGGKDMARVSSVIAKVQDFPKVAVKKNLATGAHEVKTFYEFSQAIKRDRPEVSYTDIRDLWEREYAKVSGNRVPFPKLDAETAEAVNGVFY